MRLVILDPALDGLEQIAAAIGEERDVGAIHIVSHGAPGMLQLGSTEVTLASLATATGALAAVGRALAPQGDLLLYGCEVGQGDAGAAFVAALAELTGADVAASTDLSGPADAGGNWRLERIDGAVEAAPLADDGFGLLALITGTAADERLLGTYGNDTIRGGDGNDDLDGWGGNDSLDGGAGNDTVVGDTSGNTTLAGGAGNDTLWLSRTGNYSSSPRFFTARGDEGDDLFRISSVKRLDTVNISGGTGRDTFHFEWFEEGAVTITDFAAGAAGDRIDLEGAVINDSYGAGQGGNPFAPGGVLRLAQAGSDTTISVRQEDGAYKVMITLKNVRATALTADNFTGGFRPDGAVMPGETHTGTEYGNTLLGGLFGDSLSGLGGDDALGGGGDHDTLDGGDGDDTLDGGGGNDRQLGGDGDDTLYGRHGDDTLLGGAGADEIHGEAGSDSIDGGSGDDRLSAELQGGSDTLRGGEGNDTFRLSNPYDPYGHSVRGGSIEADGGAGDDVFELDTLDGTRNVVLTGGSGRDLYRFNSAWGLDGPIVIADFMAGPGGDRIDLTPSLETLEQWARFGGGNPFGSDQPILRLVQSGADTLLQALSWKEPAEWFTLAHLQGVAAASLTMDNFIGTLDPTGNPIAGLSLNGTEAADSFRGGKLGDTLAGNGGNDVLYGEGGADRLHGGAGDDSLEGGLGSDTVSGGSGNDTLRAETGSDDLDGGDGADRLFSTLTGKARHALHGGAGNDTFAIDTDKAASGSTIAADGGAGDDTFQLSIGTADTAITLAGNEGADTYLVQSTRIAGTVRISDFGADDVLDLRSLVRYHGGYQGGNPFAPENGIFRLVQQGDDVLVQFMPSWGTFGTVVTLANTVAASLTAANFAGYGPDGGGVPGLQLSGFGVLTGSLLDDTITGSGGDDVLSGNGGNDVLFGGSETAGGDRLLGGYGADTLHGEGGADSLDGEQGNDLLFGGAGDDTMRAAQGIDTLKGGDGNDSLVANEYAVLDGEAGDDVLRVEWSAWGREGAVVLTGGAGRDVFDLGGGAPTPITITDFQVGAGGDWLDFSRLARGGYTWADPFRDGFRWVQAGADAVLQTTLGSSWDDYRTILVLQNVQVAQITQDNYLSLTLTGSGSLFGGPGRDSLTGSDGHDALIAGLGTDTLTGGAGGDWYTIDGKDVVIELAGGGNDTVQSWDSLTLQEHLENGTLLAGGTLTGNAADNRLHAYHEAGTLAGAGGNDTLVGSHLEDLLQGGAGNDSMAGEDGNDTLEAGTGSDTVSGGYGDDTLVLPGARESYTLQSTLAGLRLVSAATQEDIVATEVEHFRFADGTWALAELTAGLTGPGNDVVTGTPDADRLDGLAGADTMAGGAGDDTYVVENHGDVVSERQGDGDDTVEVAFADGGRYLLPDQVENAVVTAPGLVRVDLEGNALNNLLAGNGAANRLTGGDGRDVLEGGAGNDTMDGGAGNDVLVVDAIGDVVIESADGGRDTVVISGLATYTLGANFEGLAYEGSGAFTGTGNALDNRLWGGTGNDRLDGGAGDDLFYASPGKDTLLGGAGNDTMAAFDDAGSLQFDGGAGNDGAQYAWNLADVRITRPTESDVLVVHVATGTAILARNTERFLFKDKYLVLADIRTAYAGPGADTLNGTAAADRLDGAGGNDQLSGLGGNDTLDGGAGSDKLAGGSGDDLYYVDAAGDKVTELAGEGIDTVNTTLAKYALEANVENLVYAGTAAFAGTGNVLANAMSGGLGNDSIDGAGGIDTYVAAGAFADYTRQRPNAAEMVLVKGSQKITLKNIEQVKFTDGVKTLAELALNVASLGNDTLTGTDGNDVLDGLAGADRLGGGKGNDTYVVDNLADVIVENAAEGQDLVKVALAQGTYALAVNVEDATVTSTGAVGLTGNGLANFLTGNAAANALAGGAGNDTLDGGKGSDVLAGGVGDDTYYVDIAGDKVTELASEGTDTIVTSLARYVLAANLENVVYTGTAAFTGTGNALDNELAIGNTTGASAIDGGAGTDTFVAAGAFADYARQRPNATELVLVKGTQKITLKNVEQVRFADGVKTLAELYVNVASVASDTLSGTDGDDQMNGLAGADQLAGGKGNDLYTVDNAGDVVIELADEGIDTVNIAIAAKMTYVLAEYFEHAAITSTVAINVTGNAADNTLTGNAAANALVGGEGDDTLIGGRGNDTLTGGAGDDVYSVDAAGDVVVEAADGGYDIVEATVTKVTLADNVEELRFTGKAAFTGIGNALDNVIGGGAGNDRFTGGAGNDTFVIGAGNDTITDFTSGVDTLAINRSIGTGTVDAVTLAGPGGFSSATELVVLSTAVASLTVANVVKAIGSAAQAYGKGDTALFALHDAKSTALYLFTSRDDNAVVSANELVQIATLTGVQAFTPDDIGFLVP
ncbi:hypothetical protein GCM10007387_01160 [Pseudoduganella albidiflava]|nr:hypothetical protein GCM10007387_01160 [Pseudoduganella albidiflava]